LAQGGAPPVYAVAPEAARLALVELQAETRVRLPPADVHRETIPVGPAGSTVVWVVTPCGDHPRRTYKHWLADLMDQGADGEGRRHSRGHRERGEGKRRDHTDRKGDKSDGDDGDEKEKRKRKRKRERKRKGDPLPGIVYVHGGGWELGSFATHERLVRELADGVGAVVVFVEYDRTPEVRYPVALEQVLDTLDYLERKGCREWGIDSTRVAIAGDSAGGNLATVVAMVVATYPKLRIPDHPMRFPRLRAQLLFYPVTDYDFGTPSYAEFAGGPVLTLAAMMWFWTLYAGAKEVATRDPRLSPLRAPRRVLEDAPPAMVLTASNDVLRDQGEAYGRRLAEAGVAGRTSRVEGTVHDFAMLNGLARTKPTREGIAAAIRFLRKHLAA
jgi:acetyl esterase